MKRKDIRKYYSMPGAALTEKDGHRLNRLIAMHLRLFVLEGIFWERQQDDAKAGLFDVCDSYEEADSVVATLQLFGFVPEQEEPAPVRTPAEKGETND